MSDTPDIAVGNGCKIQNNVSVYKGLPPEAHALAQEMSDRLDRNRNAPRTDEDLPDLTQKQRERVEAFGFREKLRAERD